MHLSDETEKTLTFWEQVEKFKDNRTWVGTSGFVRLVDVMGEESAVVQAARVSYGAGTTTPSDDKTLIRYLMRHRHSTPFEMVEFKFHVRAPMDTWRQWIRHRTASVNEYSTRYSEAIDDKAKTAPDEWRLQATENKQGSSGILEEWPEGFNHKGIPFDTPGEYLSAREEGFHEQAHALYHERLELNVAREVARKDLPLSTYTEAYWKIDLHNLLHFLGLRMDSHAQLEIRQFANAIGDIVKVLYPTVWEAFVDYRLEAMFLSKQEVENLRAAIIEEVRNTRVESPHKLGKREAAEFRAKRERLGLDSFGDH